MPETETVTEAANAAVNYLPLLFFALSLSALLLGLFVGFLVWYTRRKTAMHLESENAELNLIANDLREECKRLTAQLAPNA